MPIESSSQTSSTQIAFSQRSQGLTKEGEIRLRRNLTWTSSTLLGLFVVGVIFTWIGLRDHVATALLWALACLAVGCIAGFLFAIPRVAKSSTETRKAADKTQEGESKIVVSDERGFGLGINTNLEEISDWLTKILVGLGLVELRSLPSYIQRAGYYVGQGLGVDHQSVASGLIFYFLGLGFLCGYLLTRMFIGPAFRLADQATAIGLREDAVQIAKDARSQTEATIDLYDALDAAYGSIVDYKQKNTAMPRDVAAKYVTVLEGFSRDRRWLLNRRLHLLLGNLYRTTGQLNTAIDVLTQFIDAKRMVKEMDIHLADALYNRACYYALHLASAPENQEYAQKALSDLEESIALNPSNASDAAHDEDLSSLKGNSKFESMILTA